jgi:hypothetical protein
MSTDTPAQPFGAASLLESLPSEIIEKILLEVVDYVEPVIEYVRGYRKKGRATVTESHASVVSYHLAHRLVSHTLHNNSWRAFAKVIGHTIFDIRSKESITNLSMLANTKQLAPWIRRLTISCFTPGDQYGPSESNYSTDNQRASIELFHHIRTNEQDWFPAAWRWAHSEDPISSTQALAITTEAQDLIELLSGHLRLLNKVIEIQYYYTAGWKPARFRQCIRKEWLWRDIPASFCIGSSKAGLRGCVLGLHILVEAMAAAQMTPQRLDIAGQVQDPHGFFALTSCETFRKITHKVENLALRNDPEDLRLEDGPPPTESWVAITADNFPALRSLQLDLWSFCEDFGTSTAPLPHSSDVARLTDLTLIDVPDWEPLLLDFVQLFKDSLKSITLKNFITFYDKPLIELMCDLGFDSFTLGKGTITGTKN